MACETTYFFKTFFTCFSKSKKWLFTFFEWLTTFSRTLVTNTKHQIHKRCSTLHCSSSHASDKKSMEYSCTCDNLLHMPSKPSLSFFPLFPSSFPSLSFRSFLFLSLPLFTDLRHGVARGLGCTSAPAVDPPLHSAYSWRNMFGSVATCNNRKAKH